MTTRGQKRTNEATTSQISESGVILDMLTNNQETDLTIVETQRSSKSNPTDLAKDVMKDKNIGPALAKDTIDQTQIGTSPAHAKDKGKPYFTENLLKQRKTKITKSLLSTVIPISFLLPF